VDAALDRKKRSARPFPPELDGRGEAACRTRVLTAPDGGSLWTMPLLADRVVELDVWMPFATEGRVGGIKSRDH